MKNIKKLCICFAFLFLIIKSNCFAATMDNEITMDDLFRNDASVESKEEIPKISKENEDFIKETMENEIKESVNEKEQIQTINDVENNELIVQQETIDSNSTNKNSIDSNSTNKNGTLFIFSFFVVVLSIVIGVIVTKKTIKKYK